MESVDKVIDELKSYGIVCNSDLHATPSVGVKNPLPLIVDGLYVDSVSASAVSMSVDFKLLFFENDPTMIAKDSARVAFALGSAGLPESSVSVNLVSVDPTDTQFTGPYAYLVTFECSFKESVETKNFMDI